MSRSLEDLYNALGKAIAASAPADWKVAEVSAVVHGNHAKATYDYTNSAGVSTWFDPGDDSADEIANALLEMRETMRLSRPQPWSRVRFAVERSGRFHVDYGYDESAEST